MNSNQGADRVEKKSKLGNKDPSGSELQLNYQVRAPTDPGPCIRGRYLLK